MYLTPNMDETLNIGPIFKATRKFHNLHQKDFASILNCSQGFISKIENQELGPDLILWFHFLKNFDVKDPYCFINNWLEFDEKVYKSLDGGSHLAPRYNFSGNEYVCTIQTLRPIWNYLEKNKAEHLKKFLNRHKVLQEIFLISNHPLPAGFIDDFFLFLKEIKITDEALKFVIPGFDRSKIYKVS